MNDLTVVIPTIGRKSLQSALQSIDIDCKVILSLDRSADLDIVNKIVDESNLKSNITIIPAYEFVSFTAPNLGPGLVKQSGINNVTTKYFVILDDDDVFIEGYLQYAMDLLTKTNKQWIATHDSRNIKSLTSTSWSIIAKESFMNSFFDYDHYERKLQSIYPGSEVICETEAFKSHSESTGHKFELNYLDDVIPMTSFMSSHDGILHSGYGIGYSIGENSVSHHGFDPFEKSGLKIVLIQVSELFVKTGNPVWKRAMANLLSTTRYNYSHF